MPMHVTRASVVALGILASVGVASAAAPITADKMMAPKRPKTAVAGQCKYNDPLPALPTSCGGKVPVMADCLNASSACGRDTKDNYCRKVLVEAYCATSAPEEEIVYPGGKPLKTTIHAWQSAQTGIHVPPGTNHGGKQVPFTGFTQSPPGKPVPKVGNGATALSQVGGAFAMRVITPGRNTVNMVTANDWIVKQDSARNGLFQVHQGMARGTSNTLLDVHMTNVLTGIATPLANWVGDGSDTAANRAVTSCNEFAFQRFYDYVKFKQAAKALNRDYRGIYALAIEPSSPVNLEKNLKQFGYGGQANIPTPWPAQPIPRNAFFTSVKWESGTPPNVTAAQNRIKQFTDPSSKKYINPPAGSSRFGLHKTMRAQLESRYGLSDDELDERDGRQARYMELLGTLAEIRPHLMCARFPMSCCEAPPTNTPNPLHGLLGQIRGWAVINPDPTRFSEYGLDIGPTDWYDTWRGTEQVFLHNVVNSMTNRTTPNLGGGKTSILQGAAGGLKQKTVGQVTHSLASKNGLAKNTNRYVGTTQSQDMFGGSCENGWGAQKPALEAANAAVEGSIADMMRKEFNLGAAGCLAEPVGGDLGNSCDWSYSKFARMAMTFLDGAVSYAAGECVEQTKGDFDSLKNLAKQEDVWPCEVRHDFSVGQVDVQSYIDNVKWTRLRRGCEIERAQETIDAFLAANKSTVNKIPIRGSQIGESSGDTWRIGDTDSFAASLTYNMGWNMAPSGAQKLDDGTWCKPVGGANLSATASFHFFGEEMKVLEGTSIEETKENGAFYTASARYRDMSALPNLSMKPMFNAVSNKPMPVPKIDLPMRAALLGEARYDAWFTVGPVPVHIFFGANALTGINLENIGTPTAANSCANKSKAIETVTLNYSAGSRVEPWAMAEAFADASVDVGVAAAGVHMDLVLLRLGLPTGATVLAPGKDLTMETGSDLDVDALSGRVSAYVRISAPPVFNTWEVTLFSWDGIHDSVQLWGSDATVPLKVASWAVDKKVTNAQVYCINERNTNPDNDQTVPAGRDRCLKNPLWANGNNKPHCNKYPVETPSKCSYIDLNKPYKLNTDAP